MPFPTNWTDDDEAANILQQFGPIETRLSDQDLWGQVISLMDQIADITSQIQEAFVQRNVKQAELEVRQAEIVRRHLRPDLNVDIVEVEGLRFMLSNKEGDPEAVMLLDE